MNNVEAFANEHADAVLRPLQVSTGVGPVLATPAYAVYSAVMAAAFTLGLISDAVDHHTADEIAHNGPLPVGGSASQLLGTRVDCIS